MPFGSQVAASHSPWRVLVVGPDTDAPRLVSSLKLIDPDVSIDRASTSSTAERCLLAPVAYDVAFILDSMAFGAAEPAGELVERLSVGRHPPPLVLIRTASEGQANHQLERHVPVAVDIETVNLRELIRSLQAARDLHRLDRLGLLLNAMPERLRPNANGHLDGLEPVLDDLIDAIDVLGASLSLSSDQAEVRWEVIAGERLDEPGPAAPPPANAVSSPILTVERGSTRFDAVLRVGPLPPKTQRRLHDVLAHVLDQILERVQDASDQRAAATDPQRTAVGRADDHGDQTPLAVESRSSQGSRAPATVAALGEALTTLDPKTITSLVQRELTIMHQPIMTASGTIVESDMLLGVDVHGQAGTPTRHAVVDLSALDSLDTAEARSITSTLTVPTGHWLIATAMPALRRLIDSGELEPQHRIHLGLLHRQLADRETVELITDLLRGYDIDPSSLAIDVAEPTLLEHHDTISAMNRLAGLGIRLFLDGFGGAGSNFTLLRTPLVRGVRLSSRVVRGVSADHRQASILSGLIALCGELGLEVIATGVDHAADFDWLDEYGHINVSGNVVGRPLTEEQLLGQRIS